MRFELTILGSTSAMPTVNKHHTSQLLNIRENYILLDCGEGTQSQLRKAKFKIQRIKYIFISHLHGDHYFGLIGLLYSMHLLGRQNELTIYGPKGLKDILHVQFDYAGSYFSYNINIVELTNKIDEEIILEDNAFKVKKINMNHKIPCFGFVFYETTPLKSIIKEKIEELEISLEHLALIKQGNDYKNKNGEIIKNDELTEQKYLSRSFAFCSDTLFDEKIAEKIKDVDLLYFESTFLNDMKSRAEETYHTTAKEAGIIASLSNVKHLIIGHFSVRYNDLNPLYLEAKAEFENTNLALEGNVFNLGNKIDKELIIENIF